MDIAGLNVIVTGAAKGIGKSIAVMMAARGATLSLCDIMEDAVAATAGFMPSRHIHVYCATATHAASAIYASVTQRIAANSDQVMPASASIVERHRV